MTSGKQLSLILNILLFIMADVIEAGNKMKMPSSML